MQRNIRLDDDKWLVLRLLLGLFKELPADLRCRDREIRASTILMEAIEFIRFLRAKLDVHDVTQRITEFDDLFDDRVCEKFRNSFLTKSPNAPEPTPYTRFVTINGKLVQLQNALPSFTPKKPKMIVPQQGNGSQRVILAPPSLPAPARATPKAASPGPAKVNVVKPRKHGKWCGPACSCNESDLDVWAKDNLDNVMSTNEFKARLKLLMVTGHEEEVEPLLRSDQIREAAFYKIFELMSFNAVKMKKMLQVLNKRQLPAEICARNRNKCVLVENKEWRGKKKGFVKILGVEICLPLLMLKTFKPNKFNVRFSELTVRGKTRCKMKNIVVEKEGMTTICLNPYHYKTQQGSVGDQTAEHNHDYRIFADQLTGISRRCLICGEDPEKKTIEEFEDDFEDMLEKFQKEVEEEELEPVSKKRRFEEDPVPFECWRCLCLFKDCNELKYHDCRKALNLDSVFFCCQFCGTCHKDEESVKDHLKVCGHRRELLIVKNSPLSSMQPNSCLECHAIFPSVSDLLTHTDSMSCSPTVRCSACLYHFVDNGGHNHHSCYHLRGEHHGSFIVKLDRNKISLDDGNMFSHLKPVKCIECSHTFQSFGLFKRHKKKQEGAQIVCSVCSKIFASSCMLLQHKC